MRKVIVLFLALASIGSPAWSQPQELLSDLPLDLEEKVIDGRHAMAVVPALWSNRQVRGYLPPEGFTARLQNLERPEDELTFPAGTWFLPPPGWYHVWAEGHGWISPSPRKLSYVGGVEAIVRPDMVPGGLVRLPEQVPEGPYLVLLLSANPEYRGERPPFEMKRLRPVSELGEGTMMPEGATFAALWDAAGERFVAVTRPFRVEYQETVVAPLEVPQATAHLVVELQRDAETERGRSRGVIEARLRQAGRERPPDFVVPTQLRTYAMWYELEPGEAVVTATSPHTALEPESVRLEAGSIEHRRLRMVQRRALEVDLELPSALDEEAATLTVRPLPQGPALAEVTLEPNTTSHRFEGLVPTQAEVELATRLGTFGRRVDLRESVESFVTLNPDLLTVWGRVELGGEGHAATITFRTVGRKEVKVDTDDAGEYEAAFLEPVRSVEVRLTGSEVAPYVDFFSSPIDEDRELDFHLLDVENRVEVVDAAGGEALPAATVTVRNEYEEHDEALDRAVQRAVVQRLETGEDGVALLAPFREGRIEVTASAAGYLPLDAPVRREVPDPSADLTLRIALEPLGDAVAVTLRLSDGSPAAGGEVLLVGGPDGQPVLFAGSADAEGKVEVPRSPESALLLARHPRAGGQLRDWPPARGQGSVSWTLPSSAPAPLTLEVRTSGGAEPARQAELALWLDGRRLSGGALAWLARSRPFTDPSGLWVGQNLPPVPLSVVAWSRGLRAEAMAGQLDTLATQVPFPWPSPVTIESIR